MADIVFYSIIIAMFVYFLQRVILNIFRTGDKVLILLRPRSATESLFVGVGLIMLVLIDWVYHRTTSSIVHGTAYLSLGIWQVFRCGIPPRLGEKGIFREGDFTPWNRVQSVRWMDAEKKTLVIDGKISIEVSDANRQEVVNLLKQKVPAAKDI